MTSHELARRLLALPEATVDSTAPAKGVLAPMRWYTDPARDALWPAEAPAYEAADRSRFRKALAAELVFPDRVLLNRVRPDPIE